jgi:hypothetical protein
LPCSRFAGEGQEQDGRARRRARPPVPCCRKKEGSRIAGSGWYEQDCRTRIDAHVDVRTQAGFAFSCLVLLSIAGREQEQDGRARRRARPGLPCCCRAPRSYSSLPFPSMQPLLSVSSAGARSTRTSTCALQLALLLL